MSDDIYHSYKYDYYIEMDIDTYNYIYKDFYNHYIDSYGGIADTNYGNTIYIKATSSDGVATKKIALKCFDKNTDEFYYCSEYDRHLVTDEKAYNLLKPIIEEYNKKYPYHFK